MTMTLVSPIVEDMTVTQPPAPPQWAPGYPPPQPAPQRRMVVPVVVVGLIAVAALIVGIISLAGSSSDRPVAAPTSTPAVPTFTDAEHAAAKDRVCATFNSVAHSISVATTVPDGPEPIASNVNARAAIASGALALGRSVSPATPSDVTKAANTLVDAYSNYLLTAFAGSTPQNDSDYTAMVNATHTLRTMCG